LVCAGGFCAPEDIHVAVCLLTGTELSFAYEVKRSRLWPWTTNVIHHKAAIFRQVNDWANRHREAVKGIAFMEAIIVPQRWDHWDKFNMRPALQGLRSEGGETMVLRDNFFIERILPGAILRTLSAEEVAQYRRPFAEPGEGRRPTLT
jgi:hypothetical protein